MADLCAQKKRNRCGSWKTVDTCMSKGTRGLEAAYATHMSAANAPCSVWPVPLERASRNVSGCAGKVLSLIMIDSFPVQDFAQSPDKDEWRPCTWIRLNGNGVTSRRPGVAGRGGAWRLSHAQEYAGMGASGSVPITNRWDGTGNAGL